MTYNVRNNHNSKTVKTFDNLEAAIKWCDSHTTKYGHRVTHIENGRLVTDYDNGSAAMKRTTEMHKAKCKQGGVL